MPKSRNQSSPGPGPPNPHRLGSGVTATASWFMLLGSTSVAAVACVGKSLGSRAAGGGAAGDGDGGFTEIGVASMGAREERGRGRGALTHGSVWEGGGSPLLDCEVGPVAGPPLWGLFLGFWCFSEKVFGVLFAFFLLGLGVWLWNPHGFGLVVYYLLIIYVSAFSLVGFSFLEINFGVFKHGSFAISSFQWTV